MIPCARMTEPEPVRVAVVSLGCPKALVDTEKMLALLAEAGCLVCAPEEAADVILINTCAFIAPARDESLAAIRRAVALKRRGPVRRVVVAGCLPQREGRKLLDAEGGIDAVVGVFDRTRIVEAVTAGQVPFVRVGRRPSPCQDDRGRFRLTGRHTAYLRIAEGCGAGCSFCTIPALRGPLRSKPAERVLDEARELAADGAVELNLIAQDTTAYGADLPGGTDLAGLLERLDAVESVRWLRVMYAHPARVTDRLLDALARCRRVAAYLDLPIQHVSDSVLEAMGRGYGRRDVEELLEKLRRRVAGIALRTTLMVGFPGEGPGEFKELADFVRTQRLDAVGVFTYCPEPGTRAAGLPGRPPAGASRRRRDRLMRLQQEIAFAANAAKVGSEVEVLVDGVDPAGRCVGRHPGQAPDVDSVCILRQPRPAGRIVPAKVVACDGYDLIVD